MESASVPLPHGAGGHAAEHEHHGPPEANQSSRIDRQTLGILLFIVSEVMLFGVVLRLVLLPPRRRQPGRLAAAPVRTAGRRRGDEHGDPGLLELHRSTTRSRASARATNRAMKLGLVLTWILGLTFLFVQINEYVHLGFSSRTEAFGTIFYSLTGLHGAHVFIGLCLLTVGDDPRLPRPLRQRPGEAPRGRGARASTGTSSTSCGSSSSSPSTSSSRVRWRRPRKGAGR